MTNPQKDAAKGSRIIPIKVGSAVVKIYRCIARGRTFYAVTFYRDGKRQRRNFVKLEAAKTEARRAAAAIQAGRTDVLDVSLADNEQYKAALRLLQPSGEPLISALQDYLAARSLVPSVPLAAVARDYASRYRDVEVGVTVEQVVAEFIESKRQDGVRQRYLDQLRSELRRFAKAFCGPIQDVKAASMDEWLRSRNQAPRSRNNVVKLLRMLFSYSKSRRYLMRNEETEAALLSTVKVGDVETEIYTPDQFARILAHATPKMIPFLVLGGLSGLRSAEISRLHWEAIAVDRKVLELRAGQAKTGARRVIPICDAAMAWLRPLMRTGRVLEDMEVYRDAANLSRELGIGWPRNVLRHSAISYRLALIKNASQVALEAGNSPDIIFRHYLELTSEESAKTWFGLTPQKVGNPHYALETAAEGS